MVFLRQLNKDFYQKFPSNQLEKLEAAKEARLVCLSLLSLTGFFLALLDLTGPDLALINLT